MARPSSTTEHYNRLATTGTDPATTTAVTSATSRSQNYDTLAPTAVTSATSRSQNHEAFIHKLNEACNSPSIQIRFTLFIFLVGWSATIIYVHYITYQVRHTDYPYDGLESDANYTFFLNSVTITELEAPSRNQVRGKCEVAMEIENGSDKSSYHENAVVSIFMGHQLLWVARTEPMFLEKGKRSVFKVSVDTSTISVPDSFDARGVLAESQRQNQTLKFKVKYDGLVREGMGAWVEGRAHLYILCGWFKMRFLNETTLEGGSTSCVSNMDVLPSYTNAL